MQGLLRITAGRNPDARLSPAPAAALLRAAVAAGAFDAAPGPEVDLPALHATLDTLAAQVAAVFTRLVGELRT